VAGTIREFTTEPDENDATPAQFDTMHSAASQSAPPVHTVPQWPQFRASTPGSTHAPSQHRPAPPSARMQKEPNGHGPPETISPVVPALVTPEVPVVPELDPVLPLALPVLEV
jgi:hypothetical protein